MNYKTGEKVEVGDSVLLERGKTSGTVYAVVETAEQMAEWGLEEFGVSIEAKPFGLVFWPDSEIEDPLVFIARKCT